MASGVKERGMKTNVEQGSSPKLPQPREAPGRLERLEQPLNVSGLAMSSLSTWFCQEKVLSHVMGVVSLDRETLHVLWSPGVTENRD